MKEKVDLKVCKVCGDKALGYNFNAVTCESCKAFFRRNALLQKEFVCPFNQECTITAITRRFCQKCRLDKCFTIGMRKDLIMSEQDKVLKRQKIEENRARKRTAKHLKSKFKKMKKEPEQVDADSRSQDSTNFPLYDSESSNDINSEEPYTPNNYNIESVGNFSTGEVLPNASEELILIAQNERLVSSSDDVSMIRTMLNTTPNSHQMQAGGSLLTSLISNNDMNNCAIEEKYEPVNEPTVNSSIASGQNCAAGGSNFSPSQHVPQSVGKRKTLDVTKDVVSDVQRVPVEPNSIESILCEAIKLEFEAYSSIAQSHSNSRELNDAERAKLNELIVANKALSSPLDDDVNNLVIGSDGKFQGIQGTSQQSINADPALLDVINLTAIVIRRLIKMAKKIHAFKNMCQEDQVALLKGGCTEIMILRSAMNYDPANQIWKIPHSQENLNINVDILKQAKGNVYQEHQRFIKSFDPKWRADENIILILSAIALFTPDRSKVIHQDVIKLEQNSYYYLLRRYLESIYPGCEAKSTFLKLIQTISELHKFNEELTNVYLDVNPSQVEPLLIEIFDLKH